jgi:CheY-like chemotaxis protein
MFADETVQENDIEKQKGNDKSSLKFDENETHQLKHKILVVEDDATSRDVINLFLKNIYQIFFAHDGEAALILAKENNFDLILLDINLGSGITGLEVMEKLRLFDEYKKTPIIAATAFAMLGDREKFLNSGFNHYISKPYLKQQLLQLLADSLRTSKN